MANLKLIKLFTKQQHLDILEANPSNVDAAVEYTLLGKVPISRQLVRYWRTIYLDNNGVQARANRGMEEARVLVTPSPTDDIGDTYVPTMCRRILVIGDLHCPYTHEDTTAFLKHIRDTYNPDVVVQIGDETDGHAISFHDSDPDLDSAGVELERAKMCLEELYELFPEMLVCDSNHGSLVYRRAKAHGLPVQFIKKYRDILFPEHGAPGWSWGDAWVLQTPLGSIRFQHQVSGDIMLNAAHQRMSMVVGHEHGKYGITYAASSSALYFGAYAGCLIDRKSMAFAYGKLTRNKPILGVMTITEGCPELKPMLLDSNGRWVGV